MSIAEDDNNDDILLIHGGGTIESRRYRDPKNPPKYVTPLKVKNSKVIGVILQSPHHENVDEYVWLPQQEKRFSKDSQKFNDRDIKALAKIIKKDSRRFFIMTHGTDAMVRNSEILMKELEGSGKTVVMVGAMVPLSMHNQTAPDGKIYPSDGVAALNYALKKIRNQPPGVYITGRGPHTKRLNFLLPSKVEKDPYASQKALRFTLTQR